MQVTLRTVVSRVIVIISVSFFYLQTERKCLGSINAYQLYQEEQRKLHAKSDKAKNWKAVEDEICEVKCNRKLLNKSIQAMSLKADELATETEVKHSFTLLAKSNAFRLKIRESEENEKVL